MPVMTPSDRKCVVCVSACCPSRVAGVAWDEVACTCKGCESVVTGLTRCKGISTVGNSKCVLLGLMRSVGCYSDM